MEKFIEATIQALQSDKFDAEAVSRSLNQLSDQLEAVESQYSVAPDEEEDLRVALLQAIRLYQLSLDLLGRYLQQSQPEFLERARQAARQANLQLDEIEESCADEI